MVLPRCHGGIFYNQQLFQHLLCGRCYCHVADGIATAEWEYLADVNAMWQMEWPQGLFISILVLRC